MTDDKNIMRAKLDAYISKHHCKECMFTKSEILQMPELCYLTKSEYSNFSANNCPAKKYIIK